ncbi:MAG TPA: LysR substrate-binding domain-containing protein, partial [Rhizomicrobium sp.]
AVTRLLDLHPSANVDIQTLHHDDILRSLIERDCDLAIGYDEPSHPRLESTKIGVGELVALYRKDTFANDAERISLSALQDVNFITLANSGPVGNLFSSEMLGRKLDLKERISVRTFYVAAGLVRAGAGVAVVDEYTARATLTPDIDFRPLDPPISFNVHCIYLVDRPLSPVAKTFVREFSRILESR